MRQQIVIACILAGVAILGPAPRLRADEVVDTLALYKKSVDSVAFIVGPMKGGFAMGSGTLIDKNRRYVLTSYHVVDELDKIHVQFPVYLKDGTIVPDKKKYLDRIAIEA